VFYALGGSCDSYTHAMLTAPTRCQATVVAAGVVFYERPAPSVWWAFACAAHVDEELTAARALLDRDRAELTRRQHHRHLGRNGDPDGEAVEPLATGRRARELIVAARRWADRHPDQLYPAAPPDRR
jgi:hypothetical protein